MGAVLSKLFSGRGRSRYILPAALIALLTYYYRARSKRLQQAARKVKQKQLEKEKKALQERVDRNPVSEDGKAAAKELKALSLREKRRKGPDPMYTIFKRLWPFGKGSKNRQPDARAGRLELLAIFAVSIVRTWHQNRMVYIKASLMLATYRRDTRLFQRVILETAGLSLLSSVIFALHRFLKERLTLVWRTKLTRQLHREYFSDQCYYKLSHLNERKITDVEERITRDTRRFSKALADEMEKFSAAATSGVWFTYKLTQITSLPYALSPLMYFYIAFHLSFALAPNWSKMWRGMFDRRGKYYSAHGRLQTHSEAICAYQGGAQERKILDNLWSNFLTYCHTFVEKMTLFQFVATALFQYGGHSFAEALIVGRFINPSATAAKRSYMDSVAKGGDARIAATAALFSEVRFLTEYFIRAMSAQGMIVNVLRQLQNMKGPARRLTDLFETLKEFRIEQAARSSGKKPSIATCSNKDENGKDYVSFENVQIYTPTGVLLVKDLNFRIDFGQNLLLTGCNGSGKSSIFRCLGALWPIPDGGLITKPGAVHVEIGAHDNDNEDENDGSRFGLSSSVFYLPQKPYNVLGTLREQLCYPETREKAEKMSEELLRELLREVDLEYLLDRQKKQTKKTLLKKRDDEVNWEQVLSMGEKQRLAMARLFYHRPRFAVLDECTSGVSSSMERRLYETCEKRNITCITISHRPALAQFHDVVLNILKDGKGGWTWTETKRGEVADTGAAAVGGYQAGYGKDSRNKGNALVERERLAKRSEKYISAWLGGGENEKKSDGKSLLQKIEQKKSSLTNVSTMKRLFDVLCKFCPNGFDLMDTEVRRVLFLMFLVISKTLLADRIARLDGYVLTTVLQNKMGVFGKAMIAGAFFRSFLALFDAGVERHKWFLNLEWRRRLSAYLMKLYFTANTFYDVKNHDSRIPDPEDRITEQLEQLSIVITDLWTSLLRPTFDICYNSIMLYRVLGTKGVTYVTGYMFGALCFMRLVVPNFRALRKQEFDLEGRFRFVHTRLLQHTESVAFFGGGLVERRICNNRYDDLLNHAKQSTLQTLRFNIFNNFTIRQTPDVMAFFLRMFYARSFASNKSVLSAQGGGKISSVGEYIQQTVTRSFRSFGDAFELQELLGKFFGVLENVTDLMYVLEDLADEAKVSSKKLIHSSNGKQNGHENQKSCGFAGYGSGGSLVKSNGNFIQFENVDIVAPGGTCCASGLTFKVESGKALVVTGPNAAGKSSLFRVLGGLWPFPKGKVHRPCDNETGVVTPRQVFLVPQKPYSVSGTLADQITYPHRIEKSNRTLKQETQLFELLDLVGIAYLVDRFAKKQNKESNQEACSGWDAVAIWEDVLSLGEQQRIGCARLFYHDPSFAVLDECTSAVSADVEERLYRAAKERGITSVTISQRLALEQFHTQELRMGDSNGKCGWALKNL
eukprot:g6281.t1